MAARPTYAPKVPIGWIVALYRSDALGLRDGELVARVGWRLLARCRDVLMVSASQVCCPACHAVFTVPWIGGTDDRAVPCPGCDWSITPAAFHASFRHQDLLGGNARPAFEAFLTSFPSARDAAERMLTIDRLVHAVHSTGGLAARNLLEGRPRQVLAALDALAGRGDGAT